MRYFTYKKTDRPQRLHARPYWYSWAANSTRLVYSPRKETIRVVPVGLLGHTYPARDITKIEYQFFERSYDVTTYLEVRFYLWRGERRGRALLFNHAPVGSQRAEVLRQECRQVREILIGWTRG